jgi:hypothetical protein
VAAALIAPVGAATEVLTKSDNVKSLGQFRYDGGTELAASGKYVYSSQLDGGAESPSRGTMPDQGGVHIFDVSKGKPKKAGFLHCPGNDNDVEVVKPGVIVVGSHNNICGLPTDGLNLVDVKNPKRPKILGTLVLPDGASAHTLKPYPGKPFVYVSPGGLRNGAAKQYIVDVSDLKKPEVAATFTPNATGCHDLSFHISKEKQLAFCSGYGETQIWDVSDPIAPVTIGRIHNPLIQFQHYPTASSDGTLLAIDDEAFALHDCNTGASPTGRVWIYDISIPELPILQSSFAPPRGGDGQTNIGTLPGWIKSWCLSHGLDWQPGTHNLGVTWFTGGWSVLNLDNPTLPEEIAHFQAEDSATYSILWHNGNLYTNDSIRGMEAFSVKGLPKG